MSRTLYCYLVLACLFTATADSAEAQTSNRWPVAVVATSDDTVGQNLTFAVKEEVRRSAGYRLVTTVNESLFQIRLVTLDASCSGSGIASAVAVSYTVSNMIAYREGDPQTILPIYLTTGVRTVGKERISDVAKNILASLEEDVDEYLKMSK